MTNKRPINVGDTVRIAGKNRFGKAKVRDITETTVHLETPLDGFKLWHEDDLEIVPEETNEVKDE